MLRLLALVLALSALAPPARAQVTEIWKCRGADGRWTYTNDRRDAERLKCEVVTRQVNVAPAQKPPPAPAKGARPADFPKETAAERSAARERQRDVLEKELATEQAALAKAKEELAAQEAVRNGDERNYARVEERLQPYKDTVETHEKNIEALRRELNNLYR
jgi:septal ring factor EnvC (AmiA/AmiB activator)